MPPVNQVHRDKVWKFSVKVFKGWQPLPLQPGERQVVCRFRDPDGSGQRVGTLDPAIEILRIGPSQTPDVTTGTSEGEPQALAEGAALDAAVARIRARSPQTATPLSFDPRRASKIRSRDRIDGQLVRTEQDLGAMGRGASRFLMVATFQKDEAAYALLMSCGVKLRKRWESRFQQVAKSFTWTDRKAGSVERLDVLDDVNLTPARRRAIERNLVTGWGVIVSPKKNYVVVYNTKGRRNDALAKEIARRIELIRGQVYERQFPPASKIDAVSVVRVCGDKAEYHQYGGPGGSAGYWSPGTEELVFYDSSPSKKIDDNTLSVLYHEAFHQYIHYSAGNFAPHSWFNEGHGDYYAGAELRGSRFKLKPFQWRVGIIKEAANRGPRKLISDPGQPRTFEGSGYTPLRHFLSFTQAEYYSYPAVSYAQGWSLVWFLREIVPRNRKLKKRWGHILDTYFETLKAEVAGRRGPMPSAGPTPPRMPTEGDEAEATELGITPPANAGYGAAALNKALQAAFEGVDIEELEATWLQHADGR